MHQARRGSHFCRSAVPELGSRTVSCHGMWLESACVEHRTEIHSKTSLMHLEGFPGQNSDPKISEIPFGNEPAHARPPSHAPPHTPQL
jgi:hypothetical protein